MSVFGKNTFLLYNKNEMDDKNNPQEIFLTAIEFLANQVENKNNLLAEILRVLGHYQIECIYATYNNHDKESYRNEFCFMALTLFEKATCLFQRSQSATQKSLETFKMNYANVLVNIKDTGLPETQKRLSIYTNECDANQLDFFKTSIKKYAARVRNNAKGNGAQELATALAFIINKAHFLEKRLETEKFNECIAALNGKLEELRNCCKDTQNQATLACK